ncbi:hypothetical protein [Oscillatoria acuminata]|uniref:Uncharacterized protein n=1 Tax=Oscillatoria acuminata PCC 6304 TaxID=56110 RepID=K9TCA3_9CYAN|nr:hypothetical protein [Oscillatoria acuminata]AFY80165.1 hypothetical protein Oscil6304_0415 [Oscillatoria acuminata PCC 6304]
MSSLILTPDDPGFEEWLGIPPPISSEKRGETVFVAESGTGLLRAASWKETDEYLYGGEYNDRLVEIEDAYDWDEDDEV